MDLNSFLNSQGRGAVNQLARDLKVSQPVISNWKNKKAPIPLERCLSIEKLTNGVVRCEELRPDIDWAAIRNSQPKVSAVASGQK